MTATEKQIENSILNYLEFLPECFTWKNQSAGTFDPKKGVFRLSKNKHHINGVSDILGIVRGRFLAIEVKDEKEYKYVIKHYDEIKSGRYTTNVKKKDHLKNQIDFIENIKAQGGIGFFASSIKQVQEELSAKH
jgi:penicillin-binding protein-related factor A (putative recombinase)